jgi:hypothetical protein
MPARDVNRYFEASIIKKSVMTQVWNVKQNGGLQGIALIPNILVDFESAWQMEMAFDNVNDFDFCPVML